MARKIIGNTLIGLGSFFLLASMVGMILSWVYNGPLTRRMVGNLTEVDSQLAQVETTLSTSKTEIDKTLGIIDSTDEAINKFTANDPQAFFENVQSTLGEGLVPELETARERLVSARDTLQQLRVTIFGLNVVPFININVPDKTLTDLIDSADTLQARIGEVSDLAKQASSFLDDASYLLNGNFTDARSSLEYFLGEINTYQAKIADWRKQTQYLIEGTPKWIDRASVGLTFFLLWFGFSQVGLILHGWSLRAGQNPLDVLKRDKKA